MSFTPFPPPPDRRPLQRLLAGVLISGALLVAVGVVALWILLPPVGASLTILAGGALAVVAVLGLRGAK